MTNIPPRHHQQEPGGVPGWEPGASCWNEYIFWLLQIWWSGDKTLHGDFIYSKHYTEDDTSDLQKTFSPTSDQNLQSWLAHHPLAQDLDQDWDRNPGSGSWSWVLIWQHNVCINLEMEVEANPGWRRRTAHYSILQTMYRVEQQSDTTCSPSAQKHLQLPKIYYILLGGTSRHTEIYYILLGEATRDTEWKTHLQHRWRKRSRGGGGRCWEVSALKSGLSGNKVLHAWDRKQRCRFWVQDEGAGRPISGRVRVEVEGRAVSGSVCWKAGGGRAEED